MSYSTAHEEGERSSVEPSPDRSEAVADAQLPTTMEKGFAPPLATTPSPPPNGGFTAWCQVAGSFFLFFNCCGKGPSDIAWIGSIQAFLLIIVGVVSGSLYDWGYFRALITVGSFLVVFGMMMTSICTTYWQAMLAQGLVVGLGSGCLFIPSVAILPTYFSTKKVSVLGIAASGSSLGGVIYPIVFHKLQPSIGFGWATRVIAFIMLATLVFPLAAMKVRVKPAGRRRMFEAGARTEAPFTIFSIGEFFGFIGMYIPFFFIQSYALEHQYTSEDLAFYLLAIMNAGSVFGRIIPNYIADKTGPFNVLIPTAAIAALLAFVWIGIDTAAGLIAFSVLYGFFSGTFVSLPAAAIVTLSPDMSLVRVRMGMSFALAALGLLIGAPIAGTVLEHGWPAMQAFGGTCVVVATLCMIAARVAKVGWRLTAKA